MSDETQPILKKQAVRLKTSQRWIIGLLGLAGMGAGGIAVFTESVEAGPVAMMGLGALFFLIGFLGALPTRLKIGDNEAEWLAEVSEQLSEVADLVPREAKAELAAALERLAVVAPRAASGAIAGLAYEQMVGGMLERSVGLINEGRPAAERLEMERTPLAPDSGFDALIKRGTTVLGIEMKAYSRPLPSAVVQQIVGRAHASRSQNTGGPVLLVTRSALTHAAIRAIREAAGLADYVEVTGEDDLDSLTRAVRRSLGLD